MAAAPSEDFNAADRFISLDVIRGVAVMGIFSVNVVGMAMIERAYAHPTAFGFDSLADKLMWLANYIIIDGKMRSLFSILFGASALLVIDRAAASGRSAARVHFPRMLVLMLFGLIHYYLLWWGDILTHYAAVGLLLYLVRNQPLERLVAMSACAFLIFTVGNLASSAQAFSSYSEGHSANASTEQVETARQMDQRSLASPEEFAAEARMHRSPAAHFKETLTRDRARSFGFGPLWVETIGLMLLGMAAYRAGFLTGQWSDRLYLRIAIGSLSVGALIHIAHAWLAWSSGFRPPEVQFLEEGLGATMRAPMALGYAALIILLARRQGWLVQRLAAVGRAAFTNYLGTTIVGTFIFMDIGLGLFGDLSRAECWFLVPIIWLAMLTWSKSWLDRFAYGPFEWLWRSLARWELQPMRKPIRTIY